MGIFYGDPSSNDGSAVVGYTEGSVPSGYVGEILENSSTYSATTYTSYQISLDLTAGIWIVNGSMKCDDATTLGGYAKLGISETSDSFNDYQYTQISTDSENDFAISAAAIPYSLSEATTVYLNFAAEEERDADWYFHIWAMRVA